MSKSVLANKIGDALFEVAREQNIVSETLSDLKETVLAVSDNHDFITLMNNPNLEKEKKINIIDSILVNVNENVRNVIKILVSNLQISLIDSVLEQFEQNYNKYYNNLVVKVESVYELPSEQIETIKNKFKEDLQVNNIEVSNVIDKSLIGGLKITYNNKVIDNTIKARLNSIKSQISNI